MLPGIRQRADDGLSILQTHLCSIFTARNGSDPAFGLDPCSKLLFTPDKYFQSDHAC